MKKSEAFQQIIRLSTCIGADKLGEIVFDELAAQASQIFASKAMLEAAVSSWLRRSRFVPTVADLIELRSEFRDEPPAADWECEYCSGTGFRLIWMLVTYSERVDRKDLPVSIQERISEERFLELRRNKDLTVTTAREHCSCRYGRHLHAALRARLAQDELDQIDKRRKAA